MRRRGEPEVVEHLGTRTSYTYQLEAFASAVRNARAVTTDADWAVANMESSTLPSPQRPCRRTRAVEVFGVRFPRAEYLDRVVAGQDV